MDGTAAWVVPPSPPLLLRRGVTICVTKKLGHRFSHHTPCRGAFNANHCILQHTIVLFLASAPAFLCTDCAQGFLFTVIAAVNTTSSLLIARARELEASVEMLLKEDREMHESETSPRLSTHSAVSGRTRSLARRGFRGFLTF